MITSTHVLAVRRISHILPHITLLPTTMSHPLIYILAPLASAHSVPCSMLRLPESLPSARSLTTMAMRGQLCTYSVPRRSSAYSVALLLGSVFWCAERLPNNRIMWC